MNEMSPTNIDLLAELENNGELAMLVSAPPIAFNPIFVDITGAVTTALLLSVCAQDVDGNGLEGSWTELNVDRLNRLTRLSSHEQRTARRVLTEMKLMEVRKHSFPAKTEYRINYEKLTQKVLSLARSKASASKPAQSPVTH